NLYIKACDLGNASACYNLGIMYSDGKFFAKNSANAKEYFRRACDMNFDEACKAYNNLNK
ncbi:sel1 repeat family protein, partial [Aliarcobacter butzleri]|nr:sel1 repeat family protein [Aliarcobacter butzleri]